MAFVDLHGERYHYIRRGAGVPLMLLHGFSGSLANWDAHIDVLSREFDVIAVDLLGHGQSSAPQAADRYGMAAASADLIALLDHLSVQRVHLLGYSMGGRLALYVAAHHPERVQSLILESASPGLATEAERIARIASDEALATAIERDGIEAFVAHWENISLFETQKRLPSETRERVRALRLQNRAVGLAQSLRGMGTGQQPPLWAALGDIQLPVLLLAGALDAKFVAIGQSMVEKMPNAALEVIADAGHTIHLEQPHRYQRIIAERLHRMAADS